MSFNRELSLRIATFAAIAFGAVAASSCFGAPDVGRLDPIQARPAESVQVRELGRGQTLGGILSDHLDGNEQATLLAAFREQASPRRLRVGTAVSLHSRPGDGLTRVVVALNRDETVRLEREGQGWQSSIEVVPVRVDTLMLSGRVDASLWASIVDHDDLEDMPMNDKGVLVDALDRVFQWQLDFSRQVREGDHFRVAFERWVRPDGSMREGTVVAAEFVNVGKPFRAVYFDPNGDGKGSHYDLEGNSVRRSFLLKPLSFRRISSRFSPGRRHPVLNTVRAHRGVDYAAATGTPIMATANGTIQHRGPLGSLGNAIVIAHANGFTTRYGHMSRFAPGLTVGSRVGQGEVIGFVGATGLATGPHLHYEMIRNGRHVDPLAVDLPNGDPVPSDARDRWLGELRPRVALLSSIPVASGVQMAQAIPLPDGSAGSTAERATTPSAETSGVSGGNRAPELSVAPDGR
jgi:murein DD-endopeptidase MepM/ murein hydrolase activator NlpD